MKKIYLIVLCMCFGSLLQAQITHKFKITSLKPEFNQAVAKGGETPSITQLAGGIASTNNYVAGSTMDLNFNLFLTNTDLEYGDSVAITFPLGITPNSSPTDPIGPGDGTVNTEEALNGVAGQTISWGDNDNNYGGVVPGVNYPFVINVTIDPSVTGAQSVDFHISGDGYGPSPGDLSGTITLNEAAAGDIKMIAGFAMSGCASGLAANVVYCMFQNAGTTAATNFNLSYAVNAGTPVVELYTGSVNPGDTVIYPFVTTLDMSTGGTYNIDVIAGLAGDGNPSDDVASYTANSFDPIDLTSGQHTEDFETAVVNDIPSGWSFEDVNGGIPWHVWNTAPNGGVQCIRAFENNVLTISEDWLYSPCTDLLASHTYRLSYYKRSTAGYISEMGVYVGNAPSTAAMSQTLVADHSVPSDGVYYQDTVNFSVSSDGTYYIGIKAFNNDGTNTIALRIDDYTLTDLGSVGINAISTNGIVSIHPNPSNGSTVTLTVSGTSADVEIYNAMGEMVWSFAKLTQGTHYLNLSDFASGLHSVKSMDNGRLSVQSLTITK